MGANEVTNLSQPADGIGVVNLELPLAALVVHQGHVSARLHLHLDNCLGAKGLLGQLVLVLGSVRD
eukprot:CAMPEP_0206291830 /NCGR_PEP_ID=MMETSP0106_2-20121207/3318_1 /ASSEMBLY_ACC=CAM_ASM_000206 /TAXON_ID=81532 /ORGANISM="Acanthoeca-like sp., Strain 10tr" /LENGTH=65 /DNA_ID=CAMNT_0053722395 /DNA_START=619 /DNA_END=813 /DNA_ORIENTATION=+